MNVYGDPIVAKEMLEGEFRMVEIGMSITQLMSLYWPKMFVGAVPFGGTTLIGDGATTSYIDSQGRGETRVASFGAGPGFLPTLNYSLYGAFEHQYVGFVAAAPLNILASENQYLFGTTDFPASHRGLLNPGGAANWLRGPNKLRVMFYGTGNDCPFVQLKTLNQANIPWGPQVAVPVAALGTYHFVDADVNALPATDDLVPELVLANAATIVNGTKLAVLGFRVSSKSPHWEYWSISRGASSIDNYLDLASYSLESWPGMLSMVECTHVSINHGYNESDAMTEDDFYGKYVTMIGRLRQDYAARRILLTSVYNIAGAEARTLRFAHAMQRIANDLPFVGFLDLRNECPDVAGNAPYLDVGGVHVTPEGCVHFRSIQFDLLRRLARTGQAQNLYITSQELEIR